MKKLLIDLSAIKTGGGAQRALNFIHVLTTAESVTYKVYILRPKGYFQDISSSRNIEKVIDTPVNYGVRFLFETIFLKSKLKKLGIDFALTFAGTGIPLPQGVKSIVGVAYPIICYDDSPYWALLNHKSFIKQKVKNHFRKTRLKKATIIFAQTEVMRTRLSKVLDRQIDTIKILPPASSKFISKAAKASEKVILLISGNDRHKNLWRLYDVAVVLNERDFACQFALTVDKDEWISSLSTNEVNHAIIDKYFTFYGMVKPTNIQEVYDSASMLLQLSDLESFSNNYMEAWKAEIPLIVSDRDFAREICKDSALYVDPHDPKDVAEKVVMLSNDKDLEARMISRGRYLLSELPSQEEYFQRLVSMLDT